MSLALQIYRMEGAIDVFRMLDELPDPGTAGHRMRFLKLAFKGWRRHARWERAARRYQQLSGTVGFDRPLERQARFLHELGRDTYRSRLDDLWTMLQDMVTGVSSGMGQTGRAAAEFFTLAHTSLNFRTIKLFSYNGALTRLRPNNAHVWRPHHWLWYDPGNYSYACLWYLVKKVARHYRKLYEPPLVATYAGGELLHWEQRPPPPQYTAANDLYFSMRACEERWPRQAPALYEMVGDLWEALLATGYEDAHLEYIIDNLSTIVDTFRQIFAACRYNALAPDSWIQPYHFADVLLTARSGNRRPERRVDFVTVIRGRPQVDSRGHPLLMDS